MTLAIEALPVPLHVDETGTVRVGGFRLTLDTVIHRFNGGDSPEVIAHCFPPAELADVYTVIGYYLRHRPAIDEYLRRREHDAVELRRKIEAEFPSEGLRERLLARREAMRAQPEAGGTDARQGHDVAR